MTKEKTTKENKDTTPEYTDEQRSKDTIAILEYMNLRSQERALLAELKLVQQHLQTYQPTAIEAEKRLQAADKINKLISKV